nr:unnamed protein product [Spirometra erinaceieuropaei]
MSTGAAVADVEAMEEQVEEEKEEEEEGVDDEDGSGGSGVWSNSVSGADDETAFGVVRVLHFARRCPTRLLGAGNIRWRRGQTGDG